MSCRRAVIERLSCLGAQTRVSVPLGGSPIHAVPKIWGFRTIRTVVVPALIILASLPGLRAEVFPAKQRSLQSAARRRISSGPAKVETRRLSNELGTSGLFERRDQG